MKGLPLIIKRGMSSMELQGVKVDISRASACSRMDKLGGILVSCGRGVDRDVDDGVDMSTTTNRTQVEWSVELSRPSRYGGRKKRYSRRRRWKSSCGFLPKAVRLY
jgi:hypothetical protein